MRTKMSNYLMAQYQMDTCQMDTAQMDTHQTDTDQMVWHNPTLIRSPYGLSPGLTGDT